MARYCSPQFSVRTRSSPPYRATIRPKVFHGRNSIKCAKRVLPVFTGASLENFQRMLRVQIVDTPFRSETGGIRGFQSFDPSVNRTAVVAHNGAQGVVLPPVCKGLEDVGAFH